MHTRFIRLICVYSFLCNDSLANKFKQTGPKIVMDTKSFTFTLFNKTILLQKAKQRYKNSGSRKTTEKRIHYQAYKQFALSLTWIPFVLNSLSCLVDMIPSNNIEGPTFLRRQATEGGFQRLVCHEAGKVRRLRTSSKRCASLVGISQHTFQTGLTFCHHEGNG